LSLTLVYSFLTYRNFLPRFNDARAFFLLWRNKRVKTSSNELMNYFAMKTSPPFLTPTHSLYARTYRGAIEAIIRLFFFLLSFYYFLVFFISLSLSLSLFLFLSTSLIFNRSPGSKLEFVVDDARRRCSSSRVGL